MNDTETKPYGTTFRAAVSSYEGVLINQHLGMADKLLVFDFNEDSCRLVEQRRTPPKGNGSERWEALADLISDCQFLLTNSAGRPPVEILTARGIKVCEAEGNADRRCSGSPLSGHERLHMPGPPSRVQSLGFGHGRTGAALIILLVKEIHEQNE
jgi:predicted Fe-Mo cluster-binding NifX family protein